jgi:hypothetical protein
VQKLHLVGFTTDAEGLILSARRGARSGGYTLVLDDALAQAVEEMRARQEEEEEAGIPSRRSDRAESRLPVSEIQARLRRGRSLKDVAKEAGVEPEWVERFAAPVFAEQAGIISRVQGSRLKRARLGPSAVPIGDAVRRNLVERDVILSPDEYARSWSTHQRPDGRWVVRFPFQYRGATKTLRFEVKPNGDISAGDPFTSQLAYITPPQRRTTPRPKPMAPAADPSAKRAVVSTGYRAEPPPKAVSRSAKEREKATNAMTKAAAKRAVEGERAAARKSRERAQMLARREREERSEAQRRHREATARAREAAARARLEAAEKAEREKTAAAAAAARQADRDAARQAARAKVAAEARTVAAKRSTAKAATKAAKAPAKAPAKVATKAASKSAPKRAAEVTPARKASPARAAAPRLTGSNPGERLASATGEARPRRPAAPARPPAASARPAPPARPAPAAPAPAAPAPAPTPAHRAPAAASARPDRPRPEERVAAAPPRRAARRAAADVPRPPRPEPTPDGPELTRATVDLHGPEASRALFRTGLAQPADGPATQPTAAVRAARADEAPANGEGRLRRRPPGLRRTRPLRAN